MPACGAPLAAAPADGAAAMPPRWPLSSLCARLAALRPGLRVELLAETDSTNTRLLERARAGDAAPCLLAAERQTAGRGRLGRRWFDATAQDGAAAEPGTLCFSLGLPFAPRDWSGLSLAVGVALAEALDPRVRLKWPNDLWLVDADGRGRKLGGVLVETLPLAAGPRYAVVGVGINVVAPAPRPGLEQPTAHWREIEPTARVPDLLERVAAPLLEALDGFERGGFAAFAARYAARDALAGRPIETGPPEALRGLADGVDADGALRVRVDAGLCRVRSGEVSVRPC
jgi:BirA family biotin operon repressor/biotin-[acetyl-CoA-carboxylase] ligase